MLKTLTEYMETTLSGEYMPFTEGDKVTCIEVPCDGTGPRPAHSSRQAKAVAKRMRADGWNVKLSNGILIVKH